MHDNTLTLRMYELLFSRPLYASAKRKNGRLRNDILILGSEDAGTEAFKAVYWCGQYAMDNVLNITVASNEADAFRQTLETQMPGLAQFPELAHLRFVQTGDLWMPDALASLDFREEQYDYIIIALGNAGFNHYAAEQIKKRICEIPGYAPNTIISIFDEEGESALFRCSLISREEGGIGFTPFGFDNGIARQEAYTRCQERLARLAFNISFTYATEQDSRASKNTLRQQFENDPEYSIPSYAGAVHIPYKLALCNDFTEDSEQDVHTLIDAIDTENALYNKLIAVEHRRWIAYMITCGYRAPSREELESYAFTEDNDHRELERKLHPCMCACDHTGRHLDEHYPLWETGEETWAGLAELDRMSLLLHRIADRRAEAFCEAAEDYFGFLHRRKGYAETKFYENLRLSVFKLCNDEENSVRLYHEALAEAKAAAGRQRDRYVLQALHDLEMDFRVVVFRNQKIDFFENDAILVKRIPFCLWYGEKNKTVITFTKGVLTEDIIVPTLLSAEEAIFIGENVEEDPYRPAAREYFRDRGDNTKVTTINFSHSGVEDVAAFLAQLVDSHDGAILNCVDCDDPHILMAIGFVAAEKKIPAVQYDGKRGVVQVLNPAPLGLKLIDESMSIDEFASLMGGKYKNVYANVSSIEDYDAFSAIFWKFSKERTRREWDKNGKEKIVPYSPWSSLASFFQSASTDHGCNLHSSARIPPTRYHGFFRTEVYRHCGIGAFLDDLQTYFIIKDLMVIKEPDGESVEFTFFDAMLEDVLRPFTWEFTSREADLEECLTKRLRFNPAMGGISVSGTQVESVYVGDPDDEEDRKWGRRGFIDTLSSYGMITDVSYSRDDRYVSFTYKDDKIQQIFRTHGKIFELILYHGVKTSGLFDDVQTSVEISWETNIKSFETILQERLQVQNRYGYSALRRELQILKSEQHRGTALTSTDNEIDVVMMQGMHPIFISCKTGKNGGNDWLNEIATLSHHFHAQPVLALLRDLDSAACNFLVSRARRLGVSLIGSETIANPERWNRAIKALAAGEPVFGPDTKYDKAE